MDITNEKLKKGTVAIIECFQRIPCNPCETSCPKKAIFIGEDINNIPKLNEEKCTGCGICLRNCPGLAIFLVNGIKNTVTIPYEFLPLPSENSIVDALDKNGKKICEGKVLKVLKFPDKKNTIEIQVPKEELMNVRFIKIK